MSKQKKGFGEYLVSKLPVIMAFIIPVLLLLALYIGREVFPFGESTYLRSDMYHQYAPFMREFQRNLQQGGSLLYSWNIGLGTNFASTYAYYLASPVNWLSVLFPDTLVPEFMNLMLIIKSGLMSSVFAYYLIRKFRKNNYIATSFGCFYAMSSYMAAFSWNVMWLDCLVLLPLILMGLEALVKEGRFRLYVISLAVSIISNYYISIMICIFLVFYFIYLTVCETKRSQHMSRLHSTFLFMVTSAGAGCMAMFVVLPALFNLLITASADSAFPRGMTAYYNLLEMISKSVINTDPAVFSGHFPNIYSTMALTLLIPLYWLSKRVPVREKAGKTALIALMAFSFMFNVPTYIWHGFHFPNSLPCRYSFIYILIVLTMGYQALINIRRFSLMEITICCGAGVLGIFLLQALYGSDSFTSGTAAAGALFIIIYYIIALLLKSRNTSKLLAMILLLIVSITEIVINTNETGYSTTSRTVYVSDNEAIKNMLEQVDDASFYRVEKVIRRTKNDGTWNDYNSASVFSSTSIAGNTELYSGFGMQGKTNSYSYYGHTPVTQALLGVRYEIADTPQDDPLMTEAASWEDHYLYENRYALNLGFMTDSAVHETVIPVTEPFKAQNDLIEKACGVSDVFYICSSIMGEKVVFEAEKDGRMLMYITTNLDRCTVDIEREGQNVFHRDYASLETPQIIDAQDVETGDTVIVTCNDQDVNNLTVYPAVMDYEKYEEAMSLLGSSQLEITEMQDTLIRGSIDAGNGGVMFTTIPYDEGWTVYVDGEKRVYSDFRKSFIILDLEPGIHEIEFTYWPVGLTPGIILSLAALVLFILFGFVFVRKPGAR